MDTQQHDYLSNCFGVQRNYNRIMFQFQDIVLTEEALAFYAV
jgi:hypothetical protein